MLRRSTLTFSPLFLPGPRRFCRKGGRRAGNLFLPDGKTPGTGKLPNLPKLPNTVSALLPTHSGKMAELKVKWRSLQIFRAGGTAARLDNGGIWRSCGVMEREKENGLERG